MGDIAKYFFLNGLIRALQGRKVETPLEIFLNFPVVFLTKVFIMLRTYKINTAKYIYFQVISHLNKTEHVSN